MSSVHAVNYSQAPPGYSALTTRAHTAFPTTLAEASDNASEPCTLYHIYREGQKWLRITFDDKKTPAYNIRVSRRGPYSDATADLILRQGGSSNGSIVGQSILHPRRGRGFELQFSSNLPVSLTCESTIGHARYKMRVHGIDGHLTWKHTKSGMPALTNGHLKLVNEKKEMLARFEAVAGDKKAGRLRLWGPRREEQEWVNAVTLAALSLHEQEARDTERTQPL